MNLFKFVWRTCRRMLVLSVIAAAISGACNFGLLAMVNTAINSPGGATLVVLGGFFALGLGRLASSYFSQMLSVYLCQGAIANLRRDFVQAILGAPLRKLEEIGAPRLLVALTDDVYHITQSLLAIPLMAVNVALLLGGGVYMVVLSWKMFCGLFVLILCGAAGHRLIIREATLGYGK